MEFDGAQESASGTGGSLEEPDFGTASLDAEEREASEFRQMTVAWQNEKHSPELLPYATALVGSLMRQLADQQQLIDSRIGVSHADFGFRLSFLYQMDVDQVRFVLADYHRARLAKIQRYIEYYLSTPTARGNMSPAEQQWAEQVFRAERELLASFLQQLPSSVQTPAEDLREQEALLATPDLDAHVLCHVVENVEAFRVNDSEEPIALNSGELYHITYRPIQGLLQDGKVRLV
eukprot:TRINITY_DN21069_c0_g1_i1.p1 TRINITY_DN21069_c0_g1~~TRINITY_DN21069_c0_g1_i1.p1  ORF type:complete len:234 (+),score=57.69 TRINITY_DN21069_c0_g1_i1:52-753(+)